MDDREAAAHRLAQRHYDIEPFITEIRTITSQNEQEPDEPIKLLEVNENTIPSGIMPLQFDPVPSSGIPFPLVIVEVTPEEYEQIKRHELALPDGWTLGPVLARNAAEVGTD